MSRSGRRIRTPDVVRRQRTRRLDLTTALAVLFPLVTVGGLALVHPAPSRDTTQPPSLTALTRSLVVCPSATAGITRGAVGSTRASGNVSVTAGSASSRVGVRRNGAASAPGADPLVVRGADRMAPGLVAMRSGTAPLSGQDCPNPASDQWFTGLGARADHDSVIELVNPDAGPATAVVTLLGNRQFSSRRLHGITVPAHKTISLDLGKVVPRRPTLTAHVAISRGRLAVDVLDSVTDLVKHRVRREWVPRQLAPATDNQLLGLPTGTGTRSLAIGNPTADVVRAQVKIITGDTSFAPAGLKPIPIAPGATTTVDLTKVLTQALKDGALGVAVESSGAVTASLTTSLANDRAITAPTVAFSHEAATLVPVPTGKAKATASLLLSGDRAGSARVTAYDASGRQLLGKRYGEQQGRTVSVRLPPRTAFVRVVPQGTPLRGALLVSGDGAVVVPLHELLVEGLVPQISPGQD